jgi:Holliday junction resolvase RusA-like endonuclease
MSRGVRFSMSGVPVGQGRVRSRLVRPADSRKPEFIHHYPAPASIQYQRAIAKVARIAMGSRPLLQGALKLVIVAVFPVPPSWRRAERRAALAGHLRHAVRPDADNLAKAVMDAMKGVVWRDDTQVADLVVAKWYGPAHAVGIDVNVTEIEFAAQPTSAPKPTDAAAGREAGPAHVKAETHYWRGCPRTFLQDAADGN